jgi:hypothetical protein
MANPTIGHITCPITQEPECDVRRYSTGKKSLYYVSSAGKITPNLPAGQAFMKANTVFIGENDKPLPPLTVEPPPKPEKTGGLMGFLFSEDNQ